MDRRLARIKTGQPVFGKMGSVVEVGCFGNDADAGDDDDDDDDYSFVPPAAAVAVRGDRDAE
jgi:hypothetical protein